MVVRIGRVRSYGVIAAKDHAGLSVGDGVTVGDRPLVQ